MMVFLNILKILGIILLFLLLVILLSIIIIFVTPIKYYINFENCKNMNCKIDIFWLFKIVKFYANIDENFNFIYTFKIFNKSFTNKNNYNENYDKGVMHSTENNEVKKGKDIEFNEKKEEQEFEENKKDLEETEEHKEKTNIKERSNIRRIKVSDLENKQNNKKYKNILKKKYEFFNNIEYKKEILKAVFKLIKRIFKNILPNNIYINMEIGTGDPALTGYVMGIYGISKMFYNDNINVKPCFEELKVKGILDMKGKIVLGKFIIDILLFIFTKPVFNLIKIFLKSR